MLISKEGDVIEAAIIYILIIFLSYIFLESVLIKRKAKIIKSNNQNLNKRIRYNNYLKQVDTNLQKVGYPFKLNVSKYLFFKFFIPFILFTIVINSYKSLFISIVYLISTFFLIDIILYFYSKNENILLIKEIYNISQHLVLALSGNIPFVVALKNASKNIEYNRFKTEFDKFIINYELYNFDIVKASQKLIKNFNSYELKSFLEILEQSDKEGSLIQNLSGFTDNLELSKMKYQKMQNAKKFLYVTLGSILVLANIIAIIAYPLLIELTSGISKLFI